MTNHNARISRSGRDAYIIMANCLREIDPELYARVAEINRASNERHSADTPIEITLLGVIESGVEARQPRA